jgi:hypothetical protein
MPIGLLTEGRLPGSKVFLEDFKEMVEKGNLYGYSLPKFTEALRKGLLYDKDANELRHHHKGEFAGGLFGIIDRRLTVTGISFDYPNEGDIPYLNFNIRKFQGVSGRMQLTFMSPNYLSDAVHITNEISVFSRCIHNSYLNVDEETVKAWTETIKKVSRKAEQVPDMSAFATDHKYVGKLEKRELVSKFRFRAPVFIPPYGDKVLKPEDLMNYLIASFDLVDKAYNITMELRNIKNEQSQNLKDRLMAVAEPEKSPVGS